jgi:acyl-coenzyme A synthetase/AMP-(fatty) acid ligase
VIVDRIHEWARIQPDKPAVISADVVLSYASFARNIDAYRRFLTRSDPPVGKTAVVLIDNLIEAWPIVLALRSLGLTTIAVRSIAQAEALQVREVACVVTTQAEQGAHDLKAGMLSGVKVIVAPSSIHANSHEGEPPAPPETGAFHGGHILFTSGTTGTYKKLFASSRFEDETHRWRSNIRGFDQNTVHHGLDFALWTTNGFALPPTVWHGGGTVIFDQGVDMLTYIFDHQPTHLNLLPRMSKDLLSTDWSSRPRSDLQLVSVAGSISRETASLLARRVTKTLTISYGVSESAAVLRSSFHDDDSLIWLGALGGRRFEIVDDAEQQCQPGVEGRLRLLLTETDHREYLDDPVATARSFRDGYFYPGDMAVRRADGRIRILGRVEDVIILQGHKVAVAPIEMDLRRYLEADEVCLFGHLDDAGKEELIVAIQSSSVPPQTKLEHVRKEFHFFETVRFAVLKEFPRTDTGTGKVRRAILKNLLTRGP